MAPTSSQPIRRKLVRRKQPETEVLDLDDFGGVDDIISQARTQASLAERQHSKVIKLTSSRRPAQDLSLDALIQNQDPTLDDMITTQAIKLHDDDDDDYSDNEDSYHSHTAGYDARQSIKSRRGDLDEDALPASGVRARLGQRSDPAAQPDARTKIAFRRRSSETVGNDLRNTHDGLRRQTDSSRDSPAAKELSLEERALRRSTREETARDSPDRGRTSSVRTGLLARAKGIEESSPAPKKDPPSTEKSRLKPPPDMKALAVKKSNTLEDVLLNEGNNKPITAAKGGLFARNPALSLSFKVDNKSTAPPPATSSRASSTSRTKTVASTATHSRERPPLAKRENLAPPPRFQSPIKTTTSGASRRRTPSVTAPPPAAYVPDVRTVEVPVGHSLVAQAGHTGDTVVEKLGAAYRKENLESGHSESGLLESTVVFRSADNKIKTRTGSRPMLMLASSKLEPLLRKHFQNKLASRGPEIIVALPKELNPIAITQCLGFCHGLPITVDLKAVSDTTQYLEKLFVASSYLKIKNLVHQIKSFAAKLSVDMEYSEMEEFVNNNLSNPIILDTLPLDVKTLPVRRRNYDDSRPGRHRDTTPESPKRRAPRTPTSRRKRSRDFGPDLEIQLAQNDTSENDDDDAESYAPPTPERVIEPNFETATWRTPPSRENRTGAAGTSRIRSKSPEKKSSGSGGRHVRRSRSPHRSRSPRRRGSSPKSSDRDHIRPHTRHVGRPTYERRPPPRNEDRKRHDDDDRRPYYGH